jgi:hypothetical protein
VNDGVRFTTSSVVRLVTDLDGNPRSVVGIAAKPSRAVLTRASGRRIDVLVQPNTSHAAS